MTLDIVLQAIDEAAFSVAYANMCRCLIPVSRNDYCRLHEVTEYLWQSCVCLIE